MRGVRIAALVSVAAVVGFAAAQWLWPRSAPAPEPPAAAAPEPPPAAPPPATPVATQQGELRLTSGGRIAIEAAALEPGRPVVLLLDLGAPSRSDEPRPVRIASEDGRVLDAQGGLEGERQDARVEVDPEFLSRPGRYLVEVRTTEQSPFPLRRYVIEVR
jgi:hypothetical protein